MEIIRLKNTLSLRIVSFDQGWIGGDFRDSDETAQIV
jgi:hypothetical protein